VIGSSKAKDRGSEYTRLGIFKRCDIDILNYVQCDTESKSRIQGPLDHSGLHPQVFCGVDVKPGLEPDRVGLFAKPGWTDLV
jgi:hypothetical protein